MYTPVFSLNVSFKVQCRIKSDTKQTFTVFSIYLNHHRSINVNIIGQLWQPLSNDFPSHLKKKESER